MKCGNKVTMENYHEMRDFKTSGLGEPSQWPNLVQVPKALFLNKQCNKIQDGYTNETSRNYR